jgi:8-oxo-dGTP pyrophosphatase MutT (NUDIX family)
MPAQYIRPIAICVFRKADSLFVFEGFDSVKNDSFYRPLGGEIEFGEPGKAAVEREIKEEIGEDVKNVRHISTFESLFTLEGETGHEIVMVYEADFVSESMYEKPEMQGHEDDGSRFRALWMTMEGFRDGTKRLVPDGLLELL